MGTARGAAGLNLGDAAVSSIARAGSGSARPNRGGDPISLGFRQHLERISRIGNGCGDDGDVVVAGDRRLDSPDMRHLDHMLSETLDEIVMAKPWIVFKTKGPNRWQQLSDPRMIQGA